MKYYLKGDYYFDIDPSNQLRIAGPQNHLLLGLSFPRDTDLKLVRSDLKGDQLALQLTTTTSSLLLTLPLVTDIRTLRHHTETISPTPSYARLSENKIRELLPDVVSRTIYQGRETIVCKNHYQDDDGLQQEFGAYISVDPPAHINLADFSLQLSSSSPLSIWIETIGTLHAPPLSTPLFEPSPPLPPRLFSSALIDLYQNCQEQVEYLVRTGKTSGFEYGTIFPRDWIESADLGRFDLTPATIDYMYEASMQNISESGEGWHEDLVGAYKARVKRKELHIDRKMIDIEPKYILGIRHLSSEFLTRTDTHTKLKLVARYIVDNAEDHELITFKKGVKVGNWRDSRGAYPGQESPLAPYDVNCVLYPQALKLIRDHADYFVLDPAHVDTLYHRWLAVKDRFRLYHPEGFIGYALALHGPEYTPLTIAHSDEAYDLFYNSPSLEEVVSFARKLLDPHFFYTPVGPLLVANHENLFETNNYHGRVIWPKASAYCVAGLVRQYFRGQNEDWPAQVLHEVKKAAIVTAEASFRGFTELGAAPELYYYDETSSRARYYTDQPVYEGTMSLIQLWSSIGARRIMRDYATLLGFPFTPGDRS